MPGGIRRLAEADALAFARAVLLEAGFGGADAEACADLLVETSLRGIDSHGVVTLLPVFAEQARNGVGRPGAEPAVVRHEGAVAVVEGRGASGPRSARAGLEAAMERARRLGVGAAVTRQVGYFGALWWSVSPAAEQGLVAISMTNAMAVVAPAGGREALHGTNPIAVAIPGDPDPVIVDMRTNVFRMADYWQSIASGAPLPPDSGLVRSDGSPVTDVAEIDDAVYLPLAGGKGYGLGIVVDVLTAALAGSPIGREVVWETERDDLAAFFLVLDPGFFGDPARFADGVRRLAEQARATLPVDEGSPVRLPGERGAAERGPRRRDGIPVDPTLWALLEERLAALDVGVPLPPLR